MSEGNQATLKGKLKITAVMQLKTGLHIGASSDFAPIGLADSPFIRDPFSKEPVVPGSSLKGKLRTLLAKSTTDGYVMKEIDKDDPVIKRLFGSAEKNAVRPSRLQFFDIRLTKESLERFSALETDTYIGEVKFENALSRLTAVANPRQIERVPAGAEFTFELVYNIENPDELQEDMEYVAEGLKLLTLDYLGGHGSRGYGRVGFDRFDVELSALKFAQAPAVDTGKIKELLQESCAL